MSALWKLLTFELRRRWLALPGGLLVGLLALVATPQDRLVIAFVIASLAAYLVSLVLGFTVLAGDLFAGRIGFYLVRPIPAWTLWAAKILTGTLLAAGVLVLGLVPALLTGTGAGPLAAVAGTAWWLHASLFLVVVVLLVGLGHMLRSWQEDRSAWLAMDLVLAVAAVLGLSWALSGLPSPSLGDSGIFSGPIPKIVLFGLLSLTAALLVSGGIQIAKGRADVRRGNRLAFLALWSLLLPAALGIALYARAVPGPSPVLVDEVQVAVPASRGPLVYFGGSSSRRGSDDLQLIDTDSGDFLQLGKKRPLHPLIFSPDGEHAAWLDARGVVRFWREGREHRPSFPIQLSPWQLDLGLSPGGRYLVAVDATIARIFEVSSGSELAAVGVRAKQTAMRFRDERTVRLYQATWGVPSRSPLLILDLDLEAATLERTGLIQSQGWPGLAIIDRAGDRVLQADGKGEVRLFDGRSGEPLATLAELPEVREGWGFFLEDGRIALASVEPGSGRARLQLFSPSGEPQRDLDLGPAAEVSLGTQPDHGMLWVNLLPAAESESPPASWNLVTVDLNEHVVRSSTEGVRSLPLSWDGQWRKRHFKFVPPPLSPAAGEPGARLVVRDGRQLHRFDPLSGELLALPEAAEPRS